MASKFSKYLVYSVPAFVLSACIALPAFAADEAPAEAAAAADSDNDTVIVTANKSKTDLQNTALAVTVISANALDKANASDISALSSMAPSLKVTKTGGRETVPTIRGIGAATPENTLSPGVSVYVDGVYIGDPVSVGQGLFDLQQIEVLRGPQGSLYGTSSIGGAIIMETKQPKLGETSGTAEFSGGDYDYRRARISFNAPLGDTLALRVSGQRLTHEGFTTNTESTEKLDDNNTSDVKAALLWQPTDNFSATLTAHKYWQHNNGAAQKWIEDPNEDARTVSQDFDSKNILESDFYHLNMKWDLPYFSVNSVTSKRNYNSNLASTMFYSTIELNPTYDYTPQWQHDEETVSQEIYLNSLPESKLQWTAGIFFQKQTSNTYVVEYRGTDLSDSMPEYVDPSSSSLPSNLVYGNKSKGLSRILAPYFQVTYPFTDKLSVTAGARYNYEYGKNNSTNFSAYSYSNKVADDDDTIPTWRVEADYKLTPKNMAYISVSTGYKAGGVSGNTSAQRVPSIYKSEHNTAFEIGSKNSFFNDLLKVNVAAFHYDYKNMLYIQTDPVPYNQGMSNIPNIDINGVEAEIFYTSPNRKFHFNANMAYEKGKVEGETYVLYPSVVNNVYNTSSNCAYGGQYYSQSCWDDVNAAAVNIDGNSTPMTPEFSGSINMSYDFDVFGGTLTPSVSMIYRGKEWARIFNEEGIDNIDAYTLWNADLTYLPHNANWRLSLTVSNLTDEDAINSKYTSPYESGLTSVQYVAPRQVIATIGYSF